MKRRLLEVIGVVAVVMAVAGLLKFSLVPGEGRSTGPAAKTAWGEPDLQGVWTDEFQTPLQRPAQYVNKELFTDEERADLDKRRAAGTHFGDVGLAAKGTEQDVSGAYNQVFQSQKHTGRRTSLIVEPPDGKIPPFTPEVQKRRNEIRAFQLALLQATQTCKNQLPGCAGGKYGPPSPRRAETPPYYIATGAAAGGSINRSDGPEERGLSERCMSAILPDFGGFRRIVQSPGTVTIFYDVGQGQGWNRVIPVDGSPHLPGHVRQWWGDSRGYWEGDTLVVDVTNFTAKTDFQGSRENLHLIERWRRADPKTLEYTVRIEDPTAWTKPWTVKQEYQKQSDQANRIYYEPRCHEGNFGMVGLLAGMRKHERDFAQGRGPDPAAICTAGCGSGIEDSEESDPLQ